MDRFQGHELDEWITFFSLDEIVMAFDEMRIRDYEDLLLAINDDVHIQEFQSKVDSRVFSDFRRAVSKTDGIDRTLLSGLLCVAPCGYKFEQIEKWMETLRLPRGSFYDTLKAILLRQKPSCDSYSPHDILPLASEDISAIKNELKPLEFKRFQKALGLEPPVDASVTGLPLSVHNISPALGVTAPDVSVDNVPLQSLDVADVGCVLISLALSSYVALFAEKEITGKKLFCLESAEDLKEFGISMKKLEFGCLLSSITDFKVTGVPRSELKNKSTPPPRTYPPADEPTGVEKVEVKVPSMEAGKGGLLVAADGAVAASTAPKEPLWACVYCKKLSGDDDLSCRHCKQQKFERDSASVEVSPKKPLKFSGIWHCTLCKTDNMTEVTICATCNEPRAIDGRHLPRHAVSKDIALPDGLSTSTGLATSWKCSYCNFSNTADSSAARRKSVEPIPMSISEIMSREGRVSTDYGSAAPRRSAHSIPMMSREGRVSTDAARRKSVDPIPMMTREGRISTDYGSAAPRRSAHPIPMMSREGRVSTDYSSAARRRSVDPIPMMSREGRISTTDSSSDRCAVPAICKSCNRPKSDEPPPFVLDDVFSTPRSTGLSTKLAPATTDSSDVRPFRPSRSPFLVDAATGLSKKLAPASGGSADCFIGHSLIWRCAYCRRENAADSMKCSGCKQEKMVDAAKSPTEEGSSPFSPSILKW